MPSPKSVLWMYWIAAMLFLVVALIPIARGESLNATFLALAVVFFILSIAKMKRAKTQ